MADHLPECLLRSPRDLKPEGDCICDRLRQAEQRGIQKALTAWRDTEPIHDEEVIQAERDRIRTEIMNDPTYPIRTVHSDYDEGYRDGTNDTVRIVLAVIDPKDELDD